MAMRMTKSGVPSLRRSSHRLGGRIDVDADRRVAGMWEAGLAVKDIAAVEKRTKGAVYARLRRLAREGQITVEEA